MNSMALKYIGKAMEDIKKRPLLVNSEEDLSDPSILEEILGRGMTFKDTIVTVIDLLMTGIDTVGSQTLYWRTFIYIHAILYIYCE